jgi:hypothetical protein
MLELAGSIEISTMHPALVISVEVSRQTAPAGTSLTLYVGANMRFVALDLPDRGGKLEVKNSGGDWIEQTRWFEL